MQLSWSGIICSRPCLARLVPCIRSAFVALDKWVFPHVWHPLHPMCESGPNDACWSLGIASLSVLWVPTLFLGAANFSLLQSPTTPLDFVYLKAPLGCAAFDCELQLKLPCFTVDHYYADNRAGGVSIFAVRPQLRLKSFSFVGQEVHQGRMLRVSCSSTEGCPASACVQGLCFFVLAMTIGARLLFAVIVAALLKLACNAGLISFRMGLTSRACSVYDELGGDSHVHFRFRNVVRALASELSLCSGNVSEGIAPVAKPLICCKSLDDSILFKALWPSMLLIAIFAGGTRVVHPPCMAGCTV